jgi:hypothetical protein
LSEFSPPCHIRELLDLPPGWMGAGVQQIPDSVEILTGSE